MSSTAREGTRSSGIDSKGVDDDLLCGCWELNLGLLEEQRMLLTTVAALQPPIKHSLNSLDIQDLKSLRCLASKVKVVPLWESNASSSCQVLDDEQEAIKLTRERCQEAGLWKGHCFSLSYCIKQVLEDKCLGVIS